MLTMMNYIPLLLVLAHVLVVSAYQFEGFGIFPSQSEADQLIRKANAGLWSLRLKMKLLGDPSFLVGSPHMYELGTAEYSSTAQMANKSSLRSVESDNQNTNLIFTQVDSIVGKQNWASYFGIVGPHRAVCVTTKDINPNFIYWTTGTSTCAMLRIDEQYCNGNAYQLPMVGQGIDVWASQNNPTGSLFIYCH